MNVSRPFPEAKVSITGIYEVFILTDEGLACHRVKPKRSTTTSLSRGPPGKEPQ